MTQDDSSLRPLWRLLGYARPYLGLVAITIVFSLLYAGGLTGRGYLAKPLFDDVVVPNLTADSLAELARGEGTDGLVDDSVADERAELQRRVDESFWQLMLAIGALILGMPVMRLARDYSGEWVMTRMAVDVQMDLSSKLLRVPLAHHRREGSGEFLSRITNDTVVANRAQALVFGEAVQDLAQVLLGLTWAFVLNWRLALVTLLVGPPVAGVLAIFGGRIRRSSKRRQERVAEVMGRLTQILSGITVIKAFHAEDVEREAYRRELMRFFRGSMRVIRNRVYSRALVEFFSQGAFVVMLAVGVWGVIHNLWGLTLGVLAAFMVVSAMLYRPMKNLTKLYNSVQDALPAATRIFELLDAPEQRPDPPDAQILTDLRHGVRFRDVHFSYGREAVLRGVDLELRAGETVAVVGRTGAGKSTLANLLLGFHDPDSGSVELDGRDLREIQRSSLHELVAVVSQDPFLFDTTLLENIRYGRQDASFEEVVEAARAANAHEFIEELPEGYDTPVGEFGAQLSGGQRQRVTIARAILRDPEILIFDEATSALDAKAEQRVQDAIWNLMKGRTVLVIAHRLSTVQAADRIAVLEEGRIAAQGTHDEVRASSPLYRELVDLQLAPGEGA